MFERKKVKLKIILKIIEFIIFSFIFYSFLYVFICFLFFFNRIFLIFNFYLFLLFLFSSIFYLYQTRHVHKKTKKIIGKQIEFASIELVIV